MKSGIRQACLTALLGAGVATTSAMPAAAQQFSADIVTSRDAGSGRAQKVYVADGKYRIETERGVVIADGSVTHMLMPQRKSYVDLPEAGAMAQMFAVDDAQNACPHWMDMMRRAEPEDADKAQCKRVGNETVGGRNAIKYEAVSPKGNKGYAWIDPKLRAVLKTQDAQGRGMELRNIKEASQPAELFQIPSDYKKFDMGQMRQGVPPRGDKP